jgi:hypothetical protein
MRGYFNGTSSSNAISQQQWEQLNTRAQGKIGKYNQAVNNRNALVLEGQAAQIEQKAEFDIAQFQKDFRKMEGETTVALAKSGVELGTGTAYNIELSNAYEAKLQENLIKYNSEVAAANKMEEANFARIRGTMAKQESRLAQINTVASTGSLLYGMKNK